MPDRQASEDRRRHTAATAADSDCLDARVSIERGLEALVEPRNDVAIDPKVGSISLEEDLSRNRDAEIGGGPYCPTHSIFQVWARW
jgi:hypothetical protein